MGGSRRRAIRLPSSQVSSQDGNRRITVCVFSLHPLLATELERLLPPERFRLLLRRLDPETGFENLVVPRASVYAVESHRRLDTTESLARTIIAQRGKPRILVIAESFVEANAFPLLRLGAKGLLTYSEAEAQLSRAIRVVASGGFWVPRAMLSRFVETALPAASSRWPSALGTARRLSRREKEVLELLLRNLSNKEIAKELTISARTAKFHVSNLLAKHGVRRRADLILLAHAHSEG